MKCLTDELEKILQKFASLFLLKMSKTSINVPLNYSRSVIDSIQTFLQNEGMRSANEMNAHIKLLEVWKSINIQGYLIKLLQVERSDETY